MRDTATSEPAIPIPGIIWQITSDLAKEDGLGWHDDGSRSLSRHRIRDRVPGRLVKLEEQRRKPWYLSIQDRLSCDETIVAFLRVPPVRSIPSPESMIETTSSIPKRGCA